MYQIQRLIVAKFILWLVVQTSVGFSIFYSFMIYMPELPWLVRATVGVVAFLLLEKLVFERYVKLYLFKIDEEWLKQKIKARVERRAMIREH